jgi:hypothetical protein
MSSVDFKKLSPQQKAQYTDRVWWEELGLNPDNEVIQDPHWFQVVTHTSRGLLANSVSKCEIDDENIQQRILSTIATYRDLNAPFHWVVAPSSRPSDLGKRLTEAGMQLGCTSVGIVADPKNIRIPSQPGISVEPISAKNISEYASLMAPGPFMEDHAVERHRKLAHHHLEKKAHLVGHFLARVNGEAAGIAQIRYHKDYASVPGGVPEVKSKFSKSGVYAALVAHLNADAVKKGFGIIATYAPKALASRWLDLGYEKTCEYEIYFWQPN